MAYAAGRMSRIEEMRWTRGRVLEPELLERLSPAERNYFKVLK